MSLNIIIAAFLSASVTFGCWIVGIFYPGVDLLLLPLMLILILAGISSIVTVPLILFRLIKRQSTGRYLPILVSISAGFYIAWLLIIPVNDWDTSQRNLSGKLIASALENYKAKSGVYPDVLSQLDTIHLNSSLPNTYPINRFNYSIKENGYDLDIPIPIMDRWHWDNENGEFIYCDF
jgi:hypothetical protein